MVYEFLADGFEEVEAIAPYDMLLRAGVQIKTVSIGETKTVTGAHGIRVEADMLLSELDKAPDHVILPGGMPGAKNLFECKTVTDTVLSVNEKGGIVAAICAAPFILGELGLLHGKKATCFPGFEEHLHGAVLSGERVASDGNIITAVGMGAAVLFGAEIVSSLCGRDKAEEILRSVHA